MLPSTRILLAEDVSVTRNILRAILTNEGFDVVGEAVDGEQACQRAERLKPEVLMLDIGLPKLSGMDVLKRIRAGGRDVRVVMVTSSPSTDHVREAFELGIEGFIVKPFNPVTVGHHIRRAMKDPMTSYSQAVHDAPVN